VHKIILAGHSMGGGVVLTYALKPEAPPDAYLLIAPLLGNNSPTAPASGGPAAKPSNLYVRIPRIVGEVMFSLIRVHAFDDLPVMYLNQDPPITYGLTAVISMAPADYRAAFRAIDVPLLLVAGSEDEVFRATGYTGVVQQYSSGRSVLVEGATHVSVLTSPAAVAEIKSFVETVERR
jgi:alpha-beta hydrolase superfamily lysophospholipase